MTGNESLLGAANEVALVTLRLWSDLTAQQQERVTRLLAPDPDDNLDDLAMRCERALQIIRGEKP